MAVFPFTAIVGSDDLALALLLTTVSPEVGGVLVRGEKGTAKSTMVRALAEILPPIDVMDGCRFACDPNRVDPTCPDAPHGPGHHARPARLVELPVGATDDRITGSLDLKQALGHGEATYQSGLLAEANRGILYVDEVNLLHDHLVDLLLDAAAMGRATVERDGVSISHAARIILIGTMNPEEGELRPQLLDRFGLTVAVSAPKDPAARVEVVKRRLAFDADPASFTAGYAADQAALVAQISRAIDLLPSVSLSDNAYLIISTVCAAFEVDGLRADLVTARAALAHAALASRVSVTKADIRAAARLALPHRRRRNPFDAPGLDERLLDEILDSFDDDPEPDEPKPDETDPDDPDPTEPDAPQPDESQPGTENPDDPRPDNPGENRPTDPPPETTEPKDRKDINSNANPDATIGFANTQNPFAPRFFQARGLGHGEPGKRSRAETSIGRAVGVSPDDTGRVHLVETIRHAARAARPTLEITEVKHARLEGREANLIVFCVDASGSMAARRRMSAVKTAILSLMEDAYRRRDKVALITFRGAEATLVLPPTNSIDIAATRLQELPHGGRTPLAEGLVAVARLLETERVKDTTRRPLVVLITDGRANAGPGALPNAQRLAAQLGGSPQFGSGKADAIVVDAETGKMRLGLARDLAARLGARLVQLEDLNAEAIQHEVRTTLTKRSEVA